MSPILSKKTLNKLAQKICKKWVGPHKTYTIEMKCNERLCSFGWVGRGGHKLRKPLHPPRAGGGGGPRPPPPPHKWRNPLHKGPRTQWRTLTFHDIYWLNLSKLEKPKLTNLYFHSNNCFINSQNGKCELNNYYNIWCHLQKLWNIICYSYF
jgi:hypothetical protein